MKKSEIQVGKTYTNGKGREYKVVSIGPEYKFYLAKKNTKTLRYEIVKDGSKTNYSAGQQANMTVDSFALWAKAEITEPTA